MPSIATDLPSLLSGVKRPGDFCCFGRRDIFPPGLEVRGVGPVALPLLPAQVAPLVAAAEQAPYGRGEQTLVDTTVRNAWQIDADHVGIKGRAWAASLQDIVARVADGLGVKGPVTAELYKLLVYKTGGFFVSHRDSEKTAGMFATLVIVLPGPYTGGDLLVRHQGREIRADLRSTDPSEAAFAAFYADCTHEVLPVTSGCRLALIYNLSRPGSARRPLPPSYVRETQNLTAQLRDWCAKLRTGKEGAPEKLIYPLEHAYTETSLAFGALKGADLAKAATLLAAASEAGCDLHLALVSIEEYGAAEYSGDYHSYRRGRRDDEDEDEDNEFEALEVDDRIETIADWRSPDGSRADFGDLPVVEGEVCPPDALEDLKPDQQSFQEASGNAGASFERSYRVAALVLWPSTRRLAIINQAGLTSTLPYLTTLTDRWAASGADHHSPLWAEAHELAGHMLVSWPVSRYGTAPSAEGGSAASRVLHLLTRLADAVRIDGFLALLSDTAMLAEGDADSVAGALRVLPPTRAAELLTRIIEANAAAALPACGDLLARVATAEAARMDLRPAGAALLASLPGNPARWRPEGTPVVRPAPIGHRFIADAISALERIDPALADAAAGIFADFPKTYDQDSILIPAALDLASSAVAGVASVARLRDVCAAHLRARIAEPLAPPADWTRASGIKCRCAYCGELDRFLADPNRKTWDFKSLQANRAHIEDVIRQRKFDLDTATVRRGSPHTLVCTKNQASYERRVRQRTQDLATLEKLEGIK